MEAMEPRALVGVELTGMGDDGAKAMTSLLRAGGRTIAEDASTAIVFGMPGELIRMGGAAKVLPSRPYRRTTFGLDPLRPLCR